MGLIYIASNKFIPGLLKIGRTIDLSAKKRIRSLSTHSGIPTPFKLEYEAHTVNSNQVELEIHSRLHTSRVEILREFFSVNLEYARKTCDDVITSFEKNPKYFNVYYPRYGEKWDHKELEFVKDAFANNEDAVTMSKQLGRTPYEIEVFLNSIGLINTSSFAYAIPNFRIINEKNRDDAKPNVEKKIINLANKENTIHEEKLLHLEPQNTSPPGEQIIEDLFHQLKERRSKIAKKEGIPAYMVFGDEVLEELALNQPTELDQFLQIPGIAYKKAEKYAQYFLPLIRRHRGIEGKLVLTFDKVYQARKDVQYELTSTEKKLYDALAKERKELAKEANTLAFHVFSNETLMDFVKMKPRTEEELLKIKNVGRKKIDWFGRFVIYQVEKYFPE